MRRGILGLAVIVALLWSVRPAAACSGIAPGIESFTPIAPVIAIGTIVKSDADSATLQVEQYLKGAERAPELLFNNRTVTSISPSCAQTIAPGPHVAAGSRVLVMLEASAPDASEPWRPLGLMYDGIWSIENDQIRVFDQNTGQQQAREISAVLAQIEQLTGSAPVQPEPSAATPAPAAQPATNTSAALPWLPIGLALVAVVAALGAWLARRAQQRGQRA